MVLCQQRVQLLLRTTKYSERASTPSCAVHTPSCAVHTSAGKSRGERWPRDPSTPSDVIRLCCCSELLLGLSCTQCYARRHLQGNGLAWFVLQTSGEGLWDLGCAGSDSQACSVQHWLRGSRPGYSSSSRAAL